MALLTKKYTGDILLSFEFFGRDKVMLHDETPELEVEIDISDFHQKPTEIMSPIQVGDRNAMRFFGDPPQRYASSAPLPDTTWPLWLKVVLAVAIVFSAVLVGSIYAITHP